MVGQYSNLSPIGQILYCLQGLKDRRVHSGPKERTNSHIVTLEERGEGDGQEVSSPTKRLSSSAGNLGYLVFTYLP